MEQIKDVSRTAEFANLLEVLSLEDRPLITCACATVTDCAAEAGKSNQKMFGLFPYPLLSSFPHLLRLYSSEDMPVITCA